MSKDKITVKMVEQKYRAGIQAFARTLGDPTLRLNFMQEADPFFRRCALAVWKHGSPVTEKYVDTYNTICSGENAAPSILFFELCTAVEGAPEFAPPPFFADLVRADQASRRNSAKKFTELCSILLLLFAAVDDEVTAEEAAYVDSCTQTLIAAAEAKGDSFRPQDYIAPAPNASKTQTKAKTETTDNEPEAPPPGKGGGSAG